LGPSCRVEEQPPAAAGPPRAGLPDELPAEPGPVLAPLLADPLAVDDVITALRAGSLISPPAGGMASVRRLAQAIKQPRSLPPRS
jgi:hypothetical protein